MANGLSSLSSPIVILGGLWWAGENRRGTGGTRNFTGGMNGVDILAGGFGASSAQWAGEQVQRLIGEDRLTPLLSQALAGAALSEFGDMIPQHMAMARGIHINVAQQAFSDAGFDAGQLLGDLSLGGLGGGGGGGGSSSADVSPTTNGSGSVSAADLVG